MSKIDSRASDPDQDNNLLFNVSPSDLMNHLEDGYSNLLNNLLHKQREVHLQNNPEDRGNGYAPTRQLYVKTTPVAVERPRTRNGFYPNALPKHQRSIPLGYQELLEQVLLNSKSFSSAMRTMKSLGLSYSPEQLESILQDLEQEAKRFNSRPLDSDWLAVYIDAKKGHMKDENGQVKNNILFTVVGVNFEAKKEILCYRHFWGNESIDCWRELFNGLKNRGLTRMLLIITDDFSGLKKLTETFWPHSDHQLCTVHLFRNAFRQLDKEDYQRFKDVLREVFAASSFETARQKWLDLINSLSEKYPAWTKYILSRLDNYILFMKYPRQIHRHLKSTNLPEGLNNLIETIRRDSGGHFNSEREVIIKLKLMVDSLAQKWKKPSPMFKNCLPDLCALFKQRFEAELPDDYFLTLNC